MAKQTVNIGTTANDNTGDPLRTAFDKLNDNHDEIYAAGPVGTNLQVASNTISSTNSNGNITLDPAGTGSIVCSADLVLNDSTVQTTAWKPSAVILTANASTISSSMTNFFPSSLSLTSSKYYEVQMHLIFENSSTGAVSVQLTDSATKLEQFHLQGSFMNSSSAITADVSITGTGSTAVASNTNAVHHGMIKGMITVSGATNLNIQASVASGTITPMKGSMIRVIEYSAGTVGSTA